MKVGIVVYVDIETTSGGFLYDRKLVEALREAGDDVQVVELPWRNYSRSLADSLRSKVGRHLPEDLDVLVEDELCHPSLVATDPDLPVVALVHHLRASEARSGWRERLGRPVERRIERRYLQRVDAAIYASDATRRAAERLARWRPDEAPPTIVARPAGDRFDPKIGDVERAIAERTDRDPFRVLFVGALVPRKGLHTLLDGLRGVAGDWQLTVVGEQKDESYFARVREQVRANDLSERVTFRGRLGDDALAEAFARSHLLAVPSTYEGFGIVYAEGMSFGLPALATTEGGATELVTHGEDGFLVAPESPGAVAEAVRELLRNRERLREMSLAARRRYEAHPGWNETMAEIRGFLQQVADTDQREVPA
ncbi:glycosyltransferase family 4 protein [Halorussus halophilus]|uniref:glycosyltransferase family 4 protein n=1 Tax=Halorussus halophilus TaxID=2650975 RepID=UPI001300EEEC|nr:glycosyltransferase family 4 protein [Halorussus halophilus]